MQHQKKPLRGGLTLGDPGGIGPDLVLRALMHRHFRKRVKFTVFGSESILRKESSPCQMRRKIMPIKHLAITILSVTPLKLLNNLPGKASKEGGIQSLESLDNALEHFASNAYDVLVTAPLDKQSVSEASSTTFTGQTGYIQSYANAEDSLMMMVSDVMKIALVTEHLSLAQVPKAINKDLITRKTTLLHKALIEDFNCPTQKIALLALNPHNGDRGLLRQ